MTNPIVRHLSHSISLSDSERDVEVDSKSPLSAASDIVQLTNSIASMSNRILWLDANYAPSIILDEGQVSEWYDRLVNPSIVYEDDTPIKAEEAENALPIQTSVLVGNTPRNVVRFSEAEQSLGLQEVLDSLMTGVGISFTIALACSFSEILHDDNFINIITKWDGDDGYSSFWVYLYDSPTTANLRFEVYSEDDASDGLTIIGTDNILPNRPYVIVVTYDASQPAGLDRCDLFVNGRSVKSPTSFSFGDGLADIVDGDASLQIGDHPGDEFAGYKSFKGDMYEILFFNKKIDTAEIDLVTRYLATNSGATQYLA